MDRGPSFDALGFSFRIVADNRPLNEYVEELFAALRAPYPPHHVYRLAAPGEVGDPAVLLLDDQRVAEADTEEALIREVVHDLNTRVREDPASLTMHAAGAAHAGRAIILPGSMEAGKTTLVAGLVRAGLDYLTDEAVGIDVATRHVRPYPKPLSLDPPSWPLFADAEPHADLATASYKAEQWQVAPDAIRPGATGHACPVGLVIFPTLALDSETVLEPVHRAEALVEMATHTFGFRDRGRWALEALADVVRGADAYRLTIGGLQPAVETVLDLVGERETRAVVP